ncbi:MAG TPA: DUF3592 domain-containing protein [Thermoflexales bacterium]|nr:DUF3592 domain-containing protein [Thermoflexales bacterium]HQX75667.1 DUF3592 domain-containing protein [Thermoflexales bacterium]
MQGLTEALAVTGAISGFMAMIAIIEKISDWNKFAHHAAEAQGKIVSANYGQAGDSFPNKVVVEYTAQDGATRRFEAAVAASDALGDSTLETLDEGVAVHVLYDPEHPAQAQLKTDGEPTLPHGFGFVLALVAFLWGLGVVLN